MNDLQGMQGTRAWQRRAQALQRAYRVSLGKLGGKAGGLSHPCQPNTVLLCSAPHWLVAQSLPHI